MPDPRQIIRERAAERGLSLSSLSAMTGREPAFVEQYVSADASQLPDYERRLIAMALDVDETLLGARMPWMPAVGQLGR